jgi:hypothetical protein
MGRGEPIQWQRRTATLADGRTISWTWQPAGRYPQIITAHVDDELVADRIESDGTVTRPRMLRRSWCDQSVTLTRRRIGLAL